MLYYDLWKFYRRSLQEVDRRGTRHRSKYLVWLFFGTGDRRPTEVRYPSGMSSVLPTFSHSGLINKGPHGGT